MSLSPRRTCTLAAAAFAIIAGTAAQADAQGLSTPVDLPAVPPTQDADQEQVDPSGAQPPAGTAVVAFRDIHMTGKTIVVPIRCTLSGRITLTMAGGRRLGSERFRCASSGGMARLRLEQKAARRLVRRTSWRIFASIRAGNTAASQALTLRVATLADGDHGDHTHHGARDRLLKSHNRCGYFGPSGPAVTPWRYSGSGWWNSSTYYHRFDIRCALDSAPSSWYYDFYTRQANGSYKWTESWTWDPVHSWVRIGQWIVCC
jgi:hypothetical protein